MQRLIIFSGLIFFATVIQAQNILRMDAIKPAIEKNHPTLKMLDAEARSMDEAAKGASAGWLRNWG